MNIFSSLTTIRGPITVSLIDTYAHVFTNNGDTYKENLLKLLIHEYPDGTYCVFLNTRRWGRYSKALSMWTDIELSEVPKEYQLEALFLT